jgi:hypothetical protein
MQRPIKSTRQHFQNTILISRMKSSSGVKTVSRSGRKGAAVAAAKWVMSLSVKGTERISVIDNNEKSDFDWDGIAQPNGRLDRSVKAWNILGLNDTSLNETTHNGSYA